MYSHHITLACIYNDDKGQGSSSCLFTFFFITFLYGHHHLHHHIVWATTTTNVGPNNDERAWDARCIASHAWYVFY